MEIPSKKELMNKTKKFTDYFHLGRNEIIAILIIFLFIALFLKPTVSGDGYWYYGVLEGLVQDQTLNFERQARFFGEPEALYVIDETGRHYLTAPPGLAVFSTPLYATSLILDDFEIFHIKDDFFIEKSHDILIHQLAVVLTALIFFIAGLLFTFKILGEFGFKEKWLLVLAGFFGTSLPFYTTYGIVHTHLFDLGLFTLFLYYVLNERRKILQGFLIGLMAMTRYTSGLFVIPIIVLEIWKKRYENPGKIILGIIPIAIFMLIYFIIMYGSPLPQYSGNFEFPLIHILQVLFDLDKGLLFWSPIIIISLIAILLSNEKKKWLLLSFIGIQLAIYGSWADWQGGWSFGNRHFLMFFPIYCIGLGLFLKRFEKKVTKKKAKYFVIILALYTLALFVLFISARDLIANPTIIWNLFDFWFTQNNILILPAELLKKTSFFRFIFSI